MSNLVPLEKVREYENAAVRKEFVTMRMGKQLFGISVLQVQDVLRGQKVARIPLAPPAIAGSLNLRGRIVTAIDVRERLGLAHPVEASKQKQMSVVVEYKNEFYSLMVDSVGEVLKLSMDQFEHAPGNLDARWREVAAGIFRLENELLIIFDIATLLKV